MDDFYSELLSAPSSREEEQDVLIRQLRREIRVLNDKYRNMLQDLYLEHRYELEKERQLSNRLKEVIAKQTEQLIHSNQDLEKSNRLKSEYFANLSHEIRTHINAIIGFSEILEDSNLSEDQRNYLNAVSFSGNNLLDLINNVLDISKIEVGRLELSPEPLLMHDLMKEIMNIFLLKSVNKGLEFYSELDEKFPKCIVLDHIRFKQILYNLIDNAIKFTDKGFVKLSISVISFTKASIDMEVKAQDTGTGMSQETLDNLFIPFFQKKGQDFKKYGGSGLGLSITKNLVEMMNGNLTVTSEIGKGTIFKAVFTEVPIEELFAIKESHFHFIDTTTFKNKSILIVDDEKPIRDLIINLLQPTGIIVKVAENGKEAVLICETEKPDLVLMDIHMPVMNGFESTIKIKDKWNNIPVIGFTSSTVKSEIDQIFLSGCDGFILKPISREKLIKEISRYLSI
ncbi:MAG: response regulator [Leptospiraceae bacterium]|nr:response regulator [Leptospiraceae bacterium]